MEEVYRDRQPQAHKEQCEREDAMARAEAEKDGGGASEALGRCGSRASFESGPLSFYRGKSLLACSVAAFVILASNAMSATLAECVLVLRAVCEESAILDAGKDLEYRASWRTSMFLPTAGKVGKLQ